MKVFYAFDDGCDVVRVVKIGNRGDDHGQATVDRCAASGDGSSSEVLAERHGVF